MGRDAKTQVFKSVQFVLVFAKISHFYPSTISHFFRKCFFQNFHTHSSPPQIFHSLSQPTSIFPSLSQPTSNISLPIPAHLQYLPPYPSPPPIFPSLSQPTSIFTSLSQPTSNISITILAHLQYFPPLLPISLPVIFEKETLRE